MTVIWKYKIDLTNSNVFQEIEKKRGITFPKKLKDFISSTNASTPSRCKFMIGNNEKVFGSVLSFNCNERDTDSVFIALSVIKDTNLIPIGIDPFGNYICYSLKDNTVVFWNHEDGNITSTGLSLDNFINSLY